MEAEERARRRIERDIHEGSQQALENLRQLASGIHPSVLTDRGIVEAIEARGARLPLDVMLESDPDLRTTRFDETVEGGVWFVVSECFANTLKHSRAQRVVVRSTRTDRQLSVEVSDDGIGFDPAAADAGNASGAGALACLTIPSGSRSPRTTTSSARACERCSRTPARWRSSPR